MLCVLIFEDPLKVEVFTEPRSLKSTTTLPAVGGPKTFWEDQRAWTKHFGRTKRTIKLRWEDQNGF